MYILAKSGANHCSNAFTLSHLAISNMKVLIGAALTIGKADILQMNCHVFSVLPLLPHLSSFFPVPDYFHPYPFPLFLTSCARLLLHCSPVTLSFSIPPLLRTSCSLVYAARFPSAPALTATPQRD